MFTRVVNLTGSRNIDVGVRYIDEMATPLLASGSQIMRTARRGPRQALVGWFPGTTRSCAGMLLTLRGHLRRFATVRQFDPRRWVWARQ
jgi:hypothetical protein